MELFEKYKYPIWGGLVGLLLAILLLSFGFFKTILVLILVVIGAYAGIYCQQNDLVKKYFKK